MKKLMLTLAVIATAAVTQAAAVGWSCMGLNNYAGDAYSFFVIGQNGVESLSTVTSLIDSQADISTYAFGSGTIASSGAANVPTTSSGKSLEAGSSYEAFYVIFDAASQKEATAYLSITAEQAKGLNQSPGATAASFTFAAANQATFANEKGNWTSIGGGTIDVPEPTSGLLMVLGLAGLALKRKRA